MANKRKSKIPVVVEEEDFNNYLRTENESLKEENGELARVLADTTMKYQKLMQTKLEMHQDLYSADAEKIVYKEFIKSLGIEICEYIQKFCSLTEQVTNMLNKINLMVESPAMFNEVTNSRTKCIPTSPKSTKQTMAAMPLISGSIIVRPNFDLPGLSVEQLTDMTHSNTTGKVDNNTGADETEISNNALSTSEDLSEENNESNSCAQIQKLEALPEGEGNRHNISTSQLSLPDAFRDTKVYIAPITSDIIQFKKKIHRKSFHKQFNSSNLSIKGLNPAHSLASTPTGIPSTWTTDNIDNLTTEIPTTKLSNYTARLQKFSITQLKSLVSPHSWEPPPKPNTLFQRTRINCPTTLESVRRSSNSRNLPYSNPKLSRSKKNIKRVM